MRATDPRLALAFVLDLASQIHGSLILGHGPRGHPTVAAPGPGERRGLFFAVPITPDTISGEPRG